MIYNILVKTGASKPIPGAKITFSRSGTVLSTLTTGANGMTSIDDETDGGLLDDGVLAVASASGYYDLGIAASQITANWYFELTPKPKTLLYVAGGAGAALLLSGFVFGKRKKKVSGYWDNLDPKVKTGAFIVGGIGVYLLLSKFLGGDNSNKGLEDAAARDLDTLASAGVYPSITDTEAQAYSSELVSAFDDCGTDEDKVYNVMQQLANKADLLLLIKTYGVRSYKGCFDGDYFSSHSYNLGQALSNELSSSELGKVNSILAAAGIDFKF